MSELKPCPFCGSEVSVVILDDEGNIKDKEYERDPYSGLCYAVAHDDPNGTCPIATYDEPLPLLYDSRDDVAHVWNSRAERTCRVEEDTKRASQTQLVVTKSCSECGHCFGAETHYERMFEGMVLNEIELPRYCPNCGAKVVER